MGSRRFIEEVGPRRRSTGGRLGFTLVEALLAISVVGFAAVAFSSILGGGAGSSAASKDRAISLSLAEAILEEALQLPYDGLVIGSVSSASITGYPGLASQVDVAQESAGLRRIVVTVSSSESSVRLAGFTADYAAATAADDAIGGPGGGAGDDGGGTGDVTGGTGDTGGGDKGDKGGKDKGGKGKGGKGKGKGDKGGEGGRGGKGK